MPYTIKYTFDFEDQRKWRYELSFDDSHNLIPAPCSSIKPWTKLEFCKCPNCPLSGIPQCPVAVNIDSVVEDSKETASIKMAKITVETAERTFSKTCSTQIGLFSLFGLIMASSRCPHLAWLRPLARFHLPFASADETLFRILSLQLMTDYFSKEKTGKPDSAESIKKRYAEVEKVNHSFIGRIRTHCQGDADKNAIAALDVFVQLFSFQREDNFFIYQEILSAGRIVRKNNLSVSTVSSVLLFV